MTRRWWVGAAWIVIACGCEGPAEIMPATPPGIQLERIPPTPQGGGAQALGETGASTIASTGNAPAVVPDLVPAPPTKVGESATTTGGVVYTTLKEGDGPVCQAGQTIEMHYTGTLADGTKFDSSRDRGTPATFQIGVGQLIPGWDQAVPGMKVGERRKLEIPSSLGYGSAGRSPVIPPGANLVFDIELISVK